MSDNALGCEAERTEPPDDRPRWRQKSGVEVVMAEMSVSHLRNALQLVELKIYQAERTRQQLLEELHRRLPT